MKYKIIILTLFCVATTNVSSSSILPGSIVDTEWLTENNNQVIILDVRKQIDSYHTQGHIENAVLVDVAKIRVNRTLDGNKITKLIPERAVFDDFMEKHGVDNSDTIIITHEGKTPGDLAGAARLFWQLKVYGFNQVALLNGGNQAWVTALEDITTEESKIKKATFTSSVYNSNIIAKTEDVEFALKTHSATLIDARSLRYHIGVSKKDYVYALGHIPTSKSFYYKFLTPLKGDMNILPISQIEETFKNMGINPMKPSILYCNSAYEASSVWFVMHEIMRNQNVSIYDGSLHEWTMDDKRPMTTIYGE